jgi:hypothetical protein
MKKLVILLVAAVVALVAYSSLSKTRAVAQRQPVVIQKPKAGGVQSIVSATPFTVERAWTHNWRAERPTYDAGWLLVLEVDPQLVQPTQMEEPVLYAGNETVERINHGFASGKVVAIVPSKRTPTGVVALDLAATPLWFGAPALPERVDAAYIAGELEKARALGVTPLALPAIGDLMALASRDELDPLCGELVLHNAPEEQDLGLGLLAPRVK